MRKRLVQSALVLICVSMVSCARDDAPFWPGRAVSDGPWINQVDGTALESPAPLAVPDGYDEMIQQIRALHESALERRVEQRVYDELESVFFSAGIGLELANYYREAVDLQGADSHLRPRLAWYYEQLGLTTRSLQEAELAVTGRPDDPMAHFVLAYLKWNREDTDGARQGFELALALDSEFAGPFGLTPARMLGELEAL